MDSPWMKTVVAPHQQELVPPAATSPAQRSAKLGQPNNVVLTVATSIWLPIPASHAFAFAFLRDENARSQVCPRLAGHLPLRRPTELWDTSPPSTSPRLMLARLTVTFAIAAAQWDILAHANQVQEVLRIPNGPKPDNCIFVLRVSTQPNHSSSSLFFCTNVQLCC